MIDAYASSFCRHAMMDNNLSLDQIQNTGGYGSEFELDSEEEGRRLKREDLATKKKPPKSKVPKKREVTEEYNKDEGQRHRLHFLALDAYSRHKQFINCYLQYYSGSRKDFTRDSSGDKTDIDVIRENHQFLWDDDVDDSERSWAKRLAKKYHDKLFKEYCICDLSRYKENKVAMRWRTEKEVIEGKGQFSCGSRKCNETEGLRSWEVNFGYMEHGEKKNALVKLRLCPECSYKLNYHHKKKEVKSQREIATSEEPAPKKQKPTDDLEESSSCSSATSSDTLPAAGEEKKKTTDTDEGNIWAGPAKVEEDKSREEEFDDYFQDMFL